MCISLDTEINQKNPPKPIDNSWHWQPPLHLTPRRIQCPWPHSHVDRLQQPRYHGSAHSLISWECRGHPWAGAIQQQGGLPNGRGPVLLPTARAGEVSPPSSRTAASPASCPCMSWDPQLHWEPPAALLSALPESYIPYFPITVKIQRDQNWKKCLKIKIDIIPCYKNIIIKFCQG